MAAFTHSSYVICGMESSILEASERSIFMERSPGWVSNQSIWLWVQLKQVNKNNNMPNTVIFYKHNSLRWFYFPAKQRFLLSGFDKDAARKSALFEYMYVISQKGRATQRKKITGQCFSVEMKKTAAKFQLICSEKKNNQNCHLSHFMTSFFKYRFNKVNMVHSVWINMQSCESFFFLSEYLN